MKVPRHSTQGFMRSDEQGGYVAYSDHIEAMAELQATIGHVSALMVQQNAMIAELRQKVAEKLPPAMLIGHPVTGCPMPAYLKMAQIRKPDGSTVPYLDAISDIVFLEKEKATDAIVRTARECFGAETTVNYHWSRK